MMSFLMKSLRSSVIRNGTMAFGRCYSSHIHSDEHSSTVPPTSLLTKNDFLTHFESIKQLLIDYYATRIIKYSHEECKDWITKVLDYNVPHGKLFRGLTFVHTYQYLNDKITSEQMNLVSKLGWALELFQTSFLVSDDIMDASVTRRGRKCWYKQEDVGLSAINDALFLENSVDLILDQKLRNKWYYSNVARVFREARFSTICGQHLDSKGAIFGPNISRQYAEIVRLKASFYTFKLPILAAVAMTDNLTVNEYELSELCDAVGYYFQAQDDYLDCFGDPNVSGKIGTDIQDGKCTWLIVQALDDIYNRRDVEAHNTLKENYRKDDEKSVQIVKKLYESLNIPEKYKQFENQQMEKLQKMSENLTLHQLQPLFKRILTQLHNRQK